MPGILLDLIKETLSVARELFKILIPALLLVKCLQEFGIIAFIAEAVEPLMYLFGLPGEMAIVWTTAIFTNIYAAIAVLMMFTDTLEFSVAQMTVLSTMILICHALPVELSLTHKVGVRAFFLGPLRFFGACLAGLILHHYYRFTSAYSAKARITWVEQAVEHSYLDWLSNQCINLLYILLVLFCMLSMMRLLTAFRITEFLGRLLKPLLLLMGISHKGATIAVFGLLAGITFGSGLLLAEARKNALGEKDLVLVLAFLSLCHGILEDTALRVLIGGHVSGVLFFRLFFSIVAIAILARLRGVSFGSLRTSASLATS